MSDLGGYAPYAKSVEDIKLVVTESSIKYIKILRTLHPRLTAEEAFKKWLDVIYGEKDGKLFGIVKQDKESGPMNSTCVYTNYQLINTLNLNRRQTEELLKDSLDLLHKVQTDPLYLRYQSHILAAAEEDEDGYAEDDGETVAEANYRYKLIRELLSRSDSAFRLAIYKEYRKDLTDSFKKRLQKGRLIVEGNYETLFGNPLEFLYRAADKNYFPNEPLALMDGEIYTRRFADGKLLLCARSPHITMGNVLVAKNKYIAEIDEYFCLGDACTIVCVNAIRSNIQQRLNGCDYDSDTMLITDNPIMLSAAVDLRERFPVPYCGIKEVGEDGKAAIPQQLYMLDIKIAENKVGDIVNLSQFLNCLYWDEASKGAPAEELEKIYTDICKLAVLSGIEIDRAKRDMKVSAARVLSALRERKPKELPAFYVAITDKAGRKKKKDVGMNAPLSYIYDAVGANGGQNSSEHKILYSEFFSVPRVPYNQGAKRRGWDDFYQYAQSVQRKIQHINLDVKRKDKKHKACGEHAVEDLLTEALEFSKNKYLKGDAEYWYALQKLEELTAENKRAFVFLYLLCFANNGSLLHRISPADEPMKDLVQDDEMPEEPYDIIYGHPHRLQDAKKHD